MTCVAGRRRSSHNKLATMKIEPLFLSLGIVLPYQPRAIIAFTPPPNAPTAISPSPITALCAAANNDDESYDSRREVLQKLSLLAVSALGVAVSTPTQADAADSELFKPNPLTNPVLEKVSTCNSTVCESCQCINTLSYHPLSLSPPSSYEFGIKTKQITSNTVVN